MDIPPYNTDLMIQVRDHVIEHPETHVQNIWVRRGSLCGTTACVAGWTVQLAGVPLDQTELHTYGEITAGADGRSIREHATALLGLTNLEAGRLFNGGQDESEALATLEAMIEAGKNGERLCL